MPFHSFRVLRLFLVFIIAVSSLAAFGATATTLIPAVAPHGARIVIAGTGLDATGVGVLFSDSTSAAIPATVVSRSADAIEAVVPMQAASGLVRVTGGAGTIGTLDFTVSSDPALVKITTLAADLKQPSGTFVSTAGIIYVADRMHHQIRVIAPDGTSRVLGTGKPGLLDGSSTTAQFNEPRGVVFDTLRSILYVADAGNNVVRKITADGVVSTLAGSGHPDDTDGVGTGASFKNPVGLALDASGNVLVADTLNHSIRRITPDGVVSTLAGGIHDGFADGPAAQALFKLPEGVAVSADGSVYVADTGNNLLRRIANGNVTTIAGTGHPGLLDGGTAIAEFKEPASIAVDDSGALLIADRGNDAIRRVANGLVATIAPSVGWKAPSGVASEGVIVVGDSGNDAVRVLYRSLSVSAVYPSRGLTTGGNVIRVFGTGFVPGATKVTIGGMLADVAYVASSEMRVTVPAGAVGSVDVKVETAAGSVTLSGGYTYVSPLQPPTITSVAPQKGTPAGGQTLTITGANFVAETTATIGGIAAPVTVLSPTTISIVTPAHAAGAVDVTVTTPAGSATLPSGFTYIQPPVITSFFRFGRPRTPILINGSGFDPNPTGNTVLFGNVPAVVTAATATSISTVVPDLAHTGLITVTTAAGSATSAQTFIVFTLSEIAIPSQPALDAGASVQLSAQGTYTDGFKGDLTTLATWSSNAPSIATVSSTGLVTAVDTGQATISASIFGVTGTTIITVKPPAPLPPDPSTIATPTNPTIVAPLSDSLRFIYEGPNAIQTGVPLGTITDERATLLRGRVLTIDGTPLSGVTVSILGHPEFGQTISRANGGYDLVVNGGGSLVVKFEKTRYIPAQRRAIVNWNEQKVLDDVALVAYDANVTTIALGAADAQVARGSIVSDADGTRRATLIFPPNSGVGLVMPDGTTKFVTSINVRATEFSVGPNGTNAMPAALPASSAYTYCVELSADEALATGATTVNFSKPVPFYVENFLKFPVGGVVPSGYYDRTRASWLASANGRVIKVLSITNGLADLDIQGFGTAASSADLLGFLGIDDAERQKLATLYAPGQSLWRVPITHFTPYDHNWPIGLPLDAKAPDGSTGPTYFTPCECAEEAPGSIVNVQNQSLSESIPIAGTPFSLVYNSSRISKATRYKMDMALSGATIPASLHRIDFTVQVAGRTFRASYAPGTNLKGSFTWDGLDAYGRPVQGAQNATVTLDYVYSSTYAAPVTSDQAFAEFGFGSLNVARVSSEKPLTRAWTVPMGQMSMQNTGFGGWMLDAQHFYDGNGRVLYDGVENRYADPENIQTLAISAAAGGKCCTAPVSGSSATSGFLDGTASIGFLPDGSYYVGNAFSRQPTIFRVDTNGIITTYVGGDFFGFTPDGPIGPGSALGFTDIATGPDGTLYVNEPPRVRKIANGIIKTIEGGVSSNVGPCSVDGLPAASVDVGASHIAVGPDGTVYLASGRVYAITSDGIIHRIAGSCDFSATYVDGGPALTAPLNAQIVTVGRDGTLYVGDSRGTYRVNADGRIFKIGGGVTMGSNTAQFAVTADGTVLLPDGDRIRAIASNNTVTTLVGGGVAVFRTPPANGTLARAAGLTSPVEGVQIAPDGSVYVVDPGIGAIFKTQPIFPTMRRAGTLVPSPDASEAYLFQNGRHTQTIDPLTNATLFSFSYDAIGNLTGITDADNNIVTIERNGAGEPTAIVASGGQRMTLGLTNGNLTSVTDAGGHSLAFTYNATGLLETLTDPRHNTHHFSYDENGLLTKDEDPAGGFISLTRAAINGGFSIARSSAEGRTQRHDLLIGSDLSEQRTSVATDGLVVNTTIKSNQTTSALPDGTSATATTSPDPLFGSAAPFTSATTSRLPSGLSMSVAQTSAVTLSDPSNPLSLTSRTTTTTINGASWRTIYTAANRTSVVTSPTGRSVTAILDVKGRLVSQAVANLAPIILTYNSTGLPLTTSQGSRTTTFTYDAAQRVESITDPLHRTIQFGYDASNRVVSQTLPDGRLIAFQYDENGNLTGITPPSRPQHTFAFSVADLLLAYTPPVLPNTGSTTFAYDRDHQFTLVTRPDNSTITPHYDSAGRLSLLTTTDGDTSYQYNAISGHLTSITGPNGASLTFTYDGPLETSESWAGAISGRVSHSYDNSFRILNENGAAYQYDADGFMTAAGALTIQRDPQNGRVTGATLGNLSDSWTYNAFGEPLTHSVSLSGSEAFREEYTRDDAGRVTQLIESTGGHAATTAYTYDAASRLATVVRDGAQTTTYTYDANSNRLPGTYDDQDRLLATPGSTYSYTPNGELATKTTFAGVTTYSYDPYGNLRSILLPDSRRIDYVIDAENRRIGKKVNGTILAGWLYADALRIVAETDGSGTVTKQFVYGTRAHVPDYMVMNGVTYRLITDHLGSVRFVVEASSGTAAEAITYDEFGNVLSDTNPGFQPFGFAGGLYDRDSRLVHFGARDYDAGVGRWTNKDPRGFAGGNLNLYAYAGGDPVNFVDSNGEKTYPANFQGPMKPGDCRCGESQTYSADMNDPVIKAMLKKVVPHYNNFYGESHECVALTKHFSGAPQSTRWKAGRRVTDGGIAPGTAIATFDENGDYFPHGKQKNSGIFVAYSDNPPGSIIMLDQWDEPGNRNPAGIRLVRPGRASVSDNSDAYSVITVPCGCGG